MRKVKAQQADCKAWFGLIIGPITTVEIMAEKQGWRERGDEENNKNQCELNQHVHVY